MVFDRCCRSSCIVHYTHYTVPLDAGLYTSPFCFPPSIFGGCTMGPLAAGVGFVGPLPCPLIKSIRWSPLCLPYTWLLVLTPVLLTMYCAYLLRICIPTPTELRSESSQSSCLILLHIQQLLRAGIPERRVPYVFRALIYGLRVRRAQCEGAAIGQSYELCEGVGAFRSLEKRRMSNLGSLPYLRLY
jgi:hypothetical protein